LISKLIFKPFIKNYHIQTLAGSFLNLQSPPKSLTHYVELLDNDKLALEITTPKRWNIGDKTVVLIHGLCGSDRSSYLVRMAKKLKSKNIRSVRVNLRGCGSGKGLAKKIYHCGQSNDILSVLRVLKEDNPISPIILVGFSLGGNIVLKLAGELGNYANKYISQVISINAPIDLHESIKLLSAPRNRFYEKYFLNLMKKDFYYRQKIFQDIASINFPQDMRFIDFDELYTAPVFGFNSAIDYYKKCSAKNFIQHIKIKCIILFSKDDPLIYKNAFEDLKTNNNTRIFFTDNGGHMGYISKPTLKGIHWLDNQLLSWIQQKGDFV
jgi:predicted alpha/beta-fold hydrolase